MTFGERLADVRELIASQRWIVAEKLLVPLCERHPHVEAVWRLMGDCLLAQRRFSEAEAAYDSALVANPGSSAAQLGLATIYSLRSRSDLALSILDRLPEAAETMALRRRIKAQARELEPASRFVRAVADIERALGQDDIYTALAVQDDIKREASLLRRLHWEREPILASAAYFAFNPTAESTLRHYQPDWIRVAAEFDFLHWPRRIQPWIEGRTVADVGCGHGSYSLGYVVAGAAEYVGIDPVVERQSTISRHKLRRGDAPFPCTPEEIEQRFPQVQILSGRFEEAAQARKFDTVTLHNVTEHLMDIEAVFEGLSSLMKPTSRVVFVHHNYYCWNGHHQKPASISDLDEQDREQAKYIDWRHVRFEPPPDHYIATSLNRIRLEPLRALCERLWTIETWEERRSPANVLERMTPEIRESLPEFSDDDLFVNAVFVVARPKG